ncbi:MAG: hypothetical protein LUG60_01895 [Erysipelotrichaceae bacterium]|nr:hypothetical protein [Erysipelotrichaceae bacterium]
MNDILENDLYFDEIGGILTEPLDDYTLFDIHALDKFCNDNNILPKKLSETQLKIFEL